MAAINTTTTSETPRKLRIGIMMEECQFSDLTCADLLGNLSTKYVTECIPLTNRPDLVSKSTDMEFLYLATTLEPTHMTPNIHFVPTHTYDNAPRDLDMLIIGGPLPTHRPESADRFMKEAFNSIGVVMTTCIGSLWLASSGVLKGRRATTNREALGVAGQMYPDTEWIDERWVVDLNGKLWTSGGAGAGVDMMATYAMETFDQELVKLLGLRALDFDPYARGRFYTSPIWQEDSSKRK